MVIWLVAVLGSALALAVPSALEAAAVTYTPKTVEAAFAMAGIPLEAEKPTSLDAALNIVGHLSPSEGYINTNGNLLVTVYTTAAVAQQALAAALKLQKQSPDSMMVGRCWHYQVVGNVQASYCANNGVKSTVDRWSTVRSAMSVLRSGAAGKR